MSWREGLGGVIAAAFFAFCATMPAVSQDVKNNLAPTGKLRGAFLANNPIHATKDSSGALKGPSIEIGMELARRIDVPFEPIAYPSINELMNGAQTGSWDVVFVGIIPSRAAVADFSAPYARIEGSYLVGKDSKISTMADVDKPGIRIAVLSKGAADIVLTPLLKQATLVRTATVQDALALVKTAQVDAVSALKTFLFPASDQIPGSRVLDGHVFVEQIGIGVPMGREAASAFVRKFVDEAKAGGLIGGVIQRAAQRGFVAAP